jgi:hypothetical protein
MWCNLLTRSEDAVNNPQRIEEAMNIVMCRVVHVTKITGSSSADWISEHLGNKFS